jgi:hypothetical protein
MPRTRDDGGGLVTPLHAWKSGTHCCRPAIVVALYMQVQ